MAVEQAYLPTLPRVRQALTTLVDLHAHRSFAGYLCVLNAAGLAQRTDELRPDFRAFFDRFFRIGAAPQNKPYAVPFTKNAKTILFNANVAGSYAPSSIRPVSPLHSVMTIAGGGTQAVLPCDLITLKWRSRLCCQSLCPSMRSQPSSTAMSASQARRPEPTSKRP